MIFYQILIDKKASTSARKMFHLLAIMVYIPGAINEPTLLYLASGLVMALFFMLEVRVETRLEPVFEYLISLNPQNSR